VRAGDLDKARVIYDDLKPLLEFIVAGGLAITSEGRAGAARLPGGDPRAPLLPLDEHGRAELQGLLKADC